MWIFSTLWNWLRRDIFTNNKNHLNMFSNNHCHHIQPQNKLNIHVQKALLNGTLLDNLHGLTTWIRKIGWKIQSLLSCMYHVWAQTSLSQIVWKIHHLFLQVEFNKNKTDLNIYIKRAHKSFCFTWVVCIHTPFKYL